MKSKAEEEKKQSGVADASKSIKKSLDDLFKKKKKQAVETKEEQKPEKTEEVLEAKKAKMQKKLLKM
jgi:hypothetical protein